MNILEGSQAAQLLKNLVYAKKQVHSLSVDITVKSISSFSSGGSLDFGGSEFVPGESAIIEPKKLDPSDAYAWWSLGQGLYLVEYNEGLSLPSGHVAVIQPLERLIESGITHGIRFIAESDEKPMSIIHVGPGGARIKENARISKLIVLGND
jgi:hypothetical protein